MEYPRKFVAVCYCRHLKRQNWRWRHLLARFWHHRALFFTRAGCTFPTDGGDRVSCHQFPHALASHAISFFPMSHPWLGTCHKPRHSVWERSQKGVTSPGTPLEVTYLTCHVANMPSAMSLSDIPMPKKVITDVTSADIAKSQERERERDRAYLYRATSTSNKNLSQPWQQ